MSRKAECEAQYAKSLKEHERHLREAREQHARSLEEWAREKQSFLECQAASNAAVDALREQYEAGAPDAVVTYFEMVPTLNTSRKRSICNTNHNRAHSS